MKRFIALLLCVFGLLATPLRADVELSFDFYYDQLSPMGEWVEVDGYGYVWHPNGVDEDWAPYIDGYWTYTDAGWTWVSYEDWGAICYHYGRWVHLLDYGWCWVPGYDWGPAWVSWRSSDDYIGWAPLPPECDWDVDRGVSVWVDTHYDIGPRWYSFCRIRDFGAPVIRHVCLPRIRNFDICFSTVNCTNISYNRGYGCVFNGGFEYDYIRSRADRHIPTLKLVQNTTNIFINNNRGNVFVNSPRGNTLVVAAPRVAVNAKQFTRKPAIRRTFDRNAVTRGWNGVDKPETRDRLVSKMRAETKGLTPANAKARPVKQEALAVVLPKEVKLDAPTPGMKRLPAERGNRETVRDPGSERLTPAEREGRIEKMRPNERAETAEVPKEGDAGKPKGRPVAGADNPNGGLRKRPNGEAGETAELERPAVTVPGVPAEKRAGDGGKPDRVAKPENPANDRVPGRVAEQEDRSNDKVERAARTGEMREAQENARRQSQENADSAARTHQENAAREKTAREAAERQANQREQAEAARAAAENAQRQREAGENAGRAAEMKRQAQENAGRENAARENATRENAAQAAAARRAQMEAQQARQNRAGEQAEAAQRQAAQRAENARRAAAEQPNENVRRQAMERQNEARQEAAQRQAEAQRERAASQQNEARERAANAQREQAAENARARAMENHQRAAANAQAQAQARTEAQQQQQQQQQQRAAAQAQAAARQQSEARSQQQDSDDRKKKR